VDTPKDFAVLSAVVEHFVERGMDYFSLAQILEFLAAHPELTAANRDVPRRWKQFRKEAAGG
jgi:spore coat polysaccharide biosynthesis protein SpsF (cytidylyltransferase family)